MHILLTGPFGNLGRYTVRELLAQGHTVRCFDLRTPQTLRAAREFGDRIEIVWGDLRDADALRAAVSGVDAVIHLAAIIPPLSNEQPDLARDVNINGTRLLLQACNRLRKKPRFLFASTFDLFGYTQKKKPPRKVSDPIQVTDVYTETKAAGEKMVIQSKLDWLIFRLADMPIIGLRAAHPIMYEIGLHNRIEALHPADAALAIANALKLDDLWKQGKTLLIGGGPRCQVTYGQYLGKILEAMGVGMLPESAFSGKDYVTDWLDTRESERLLKYQRHSFDDVVREIAAQLSWRRPFIPLARPFARRAMLKLSPYYSK